MNVYFILHYNLFFRKELFFEYLYFSEYNIRMFLFIFWLRNRLSIKYVRNWGNGGVHPKRFQVRTGGRGVQNSVKRYVSTKWMAPNKRCGIFLCISSVKYTRASPPVGKMLLISSIIITILSNAVIRI